ncbi:MAG: LysR family transcriptional regulator [Tissierellia bacterium]|nr:LysR family transcriptional regulator [Tissierellia bacterium]
MNTSYLRTFIEVIDLKNISKAAEKLFVTQPAVSKQLKLLEHDFGAELFRKSGREIYPTEEGEILYKYAKNVLSEENKIYSMLKKDGKLTGTLTIYTSSVPADYYIQDLIFKFHSLYPDINYVINKVDSDIVFKNIEEGFTSFGFTGSTYKNKKIDSICIAEDEVVLVASAKRNELKDSIKASDLLNQNFVLREKGSATLHIFEKYLIKNKIKLDDLNIIVLAEDNEIIKQFILNDMGIGILPLKAVEKEINEGKLFVVKIDDMQLTRKLYYVYQKDRYFSNVEEKFKEFMENKEA